MGLKKEKEKRKKIKKLQEKKKKKKKSYPEFLVFLHNIFFIIAVNGEVKDWDLKLLDVFHNLMMIKIIIGMCDIEDKKEGSDRKESLPSS